MRFRTIVLLIFILLVACSENSKVKVSPIKEIYRKTSPKTSSPFQEEQEPTQVKQEDRNPKQPEKPPTSQATVKQIVLSWPAKGSISSEYGSRDGKMHHGIDIKRNNGKNIMASAPGIIKFSGKNGGFGKMIIIDHGNGIETFYAHCSKLFAMKKSKVRRGQLIAKMGSSGKSDGVHLHFEIRIDGKSKNPLKYLPVR